MAEFDPDEYLAGGTAVAEPPFNPDEYLGQAASFNPDEYLKSVPAEFAQADEQAEIERTAGAKAPQWVKSAAEAVPGIVKQAMKLPARAGILAATGGLVNPTDEQLEKTLVSPEIAQMVLKAPLGGMFGNAGINQAETGIPGAIRGAVEATGDAVSGLTTPENIGQLALAPAGKIAQRLIAGVFEGQAIAGLPEQWEALKNAKTLREQVKIGGGMVLGTGAPALGFMATLKGGKAKSAEVPKVEVEVPLAPSDNPAMARFQAVAPEETAPKPSAVQQRDAEFQAMSENLNELNKDQFLPDRPTPESPVVEAPVSEPRPTSIKNEVTAVEREARGIAEAEQAASRDFGTVWQEAAEIAAKDVDAPADLVRSINESKGGIALTDTQNALLLRRQIDVQAKHDAAVRAVNEAPDAPARQEAQAKLDRVRDDLQLVYDATKRAGTEQGRGLNARKMLANQDYSLAKMEATTRAVVNQGKPLSAFQLAKVKGEHMRIQKMETRLKEYERRERFADFIKEAKREGKMRKKSGKTHQRFVEERASAARERIAKNGVCSL